VFTVIFFRDNSRIFVFIQAMKRRFHFWRVFLLRKGILPVLRLPFHRRIFYAILGILIVLTIAVLIQGIYYTRYHGNILGEIDRGLFFFIIAGMIAQLIDGALGMAYGVSCTSLLLGMNVAPAIASASVHVSEVFTSGISGISHLYFRNIDKKLFLRLVFWGVAGGVTGAWLLSDILNGMYVKPFISCYLLILGVVILIGAFQGGKKKSPPKRVGLLAILGGFMDAIGGGGWGPIVTSRLIRRNINPRRIIGTVNISEFFITFSTSGVFLILIGVDSWKPIIGLIVGGGIAAPFTAWIVRIIHHKFLTVMVGILVCLLSIYNLYTSWDVLMKIGNAVGLTGT